MDIFLVFSIRYADFGKSAQAVEEEWVVKRWGKLRVTSGELEG